MHRKKEPHPAECKVRLVRSYLTVRSNTLDATVPVESLMSTLRLKEPVVEDVYLQVVDVVLAEPIVV